MLRCTVYIGSAAASTDLSRRSNRGGRTMYCPVAWATRSVPLAASAFQPLDYFPTKEPSGARMKSSESGRKARQPPSSMEPMTRTAPSGFASQKN